MYSVHTYVRICKCSQIEDVGLEEQDEIIESEPEEEEEKEEKKGESCGCGSLLKVGGAANPHPVQLNQYS